MSRRFNGWCWFTAAALGACAPPSGDQALPRSEGPERVDDTRELRLDDVLDATRYGFRARGDGDWVARADGFGVRASDGRVALEAEGLATFVLRTPGALSAPDHGGELHRGARERLRVTERGLEQSWHYDRSPGAAIEVRVEVDDVSLAVADARGLHLRSSVGDGFLRYGHGTWIDAGGHRTPVPAQWEEGAVVLRVPRETVATSTFPAVLDPIISPEFEVGGDFDWAASSIGGHGGASSGTQALVAWVQRGVSEHVIASRVDATGTLLDGRGALLATGTTILREPLVLFDGSQYVVFYQNGFDLRAVRVTPAGAVLDPSPGVLLGPADGFRPRGAFGGGFHFIAFVTPSSGRSIVSVRRLRPDLTWEDPAPIQLEDTRRAIDQMSVGYGGGRALIAWTRRSHPITEVRARRVSAAGVIEDAAPIQLDEGDQVAHSIPIGVGSDGSDFLVTWVNGTSISVARVAASGALLDPTPVSVGGAPVTLTGTHWDGGTYRVGYIAHDSSIGRFRHHVVGVDTSAGTPVASPPIEAGGPEDARSDWNGVLIPGSPPLATWEVVDPRRIVGVRFDADVGGGVNFPISLGGNAQTEPDLNWNAAASAHLVVWQDERFVDPGVYGLRLSNLGAPLDALGVQVAPERASDAHVTALGAGWVVSWLQRDGPGDDTYLHGQRVTALGRLDGPPFEFMVGPVGPHDIASDGTHLYLTFMPRRPIFSRGPLWGIRLRDDGTSPDAAPVELGDSTLDFAVAANAAGFQVAFTCNCGGGFAGRYVRVRSDGTLLDATPIPVGSHAEPETLVGDGTDTLMVYTEGRFLTRGGLAASRILADGTIVDPAPGIGIDTTNRIYYASAAYDGTDYVLAWKLGSRTSTALHLAFLTPTGVVSSGSPHLITPSADRGTALSSDGTGHTLVAYWQYSPGHRHSRLRVRHVSRFEADGTSCTADFECASGHCVDGVCCADACGGSDPSDCQACSVAAGSSTDGSCEPLGAGVECRGGTLPCDPAERCDGVTPTCPAEIFAMDGTVCDSGPVCDGTDVCIAGTCSPGSALDCDDADVCTADSCAEPAGCAHAAIAGCCRDHGECDDGDLCTADTCEATNECAYAEIAGCCRADADCNDGDACTADACDAATGECQTTTISECCREDDDCDDGMACTADVCDPESNRCTASEVMGCCRTDADCTSEDVCAVGTCDAEVGACSYADRDGCCRVDVDCDDGDPCTFDHCDGSGSCEHEPGACPEPVEETGCGCVAAGSGGRNTTPIALAVLGVWALLWRRRSRLGPRQRWCPATRSRGQP